MTTRADRHGDGSPPADLVQTSALSANPRVLTGLNRTSANNYGALTPRKPPNQVIESAHGGGQELHTCCAAAHNDPPTPHPHPIIAPPVRGVCEKKTSLFSLPDHLRLCLAFPSEPRPPQPHHVLTPHLLWTLSSHRPIGTGQPSVPFVMPFCQQSASECQCCSFNGVSKFLVSFPSFKACDQPHVIGWISSVAI